MHSRFYKYFARNISLLAPALAAAASIVAMSTFFLKDLAPSSTLPILTGVLASLLGAVFAYAFAKAYKLASRRPPAVFISYSHKDTEFADQLADALKKIDVEPIVDRLELKVGDDIRAAVDEMIDRSDYFLFVISKNSANSNWAKKEIEQATKRDKRILPVVLDAEAIPEPLSGMYYADFTGDFEGGIAQLRKTFQPQKG
ncbi:MAG: toll/interleukin-1 receptor domain-containing protein [Verrucomicrobiales bacterium]|nr:toll/interleukin-1 receptor domain-containing protein [Verrucomicrobiales bacterium]